MQPKWHTRIRRDIDVIQCYGSSSVALWNGSMVSWQWALSHLVHEKKERKFKKWYYVDIMTMERVIEYILKAQKPPHIDFISSHGRQAKRFERYIKTKFWILDRRKVWRNGLENETHHICVNRFPVSQFGKHMEPHVSRITLDTLNQILDRRKIWRNSLENEMHHTSFMVPR